MTATTYAENAELVALAFDLADESARSDIECLCVAEDAAGYNTRRLVGAHEDLKYNRSVVDKALRYLELRGDKTTHFRFVRTASEPHIVRFEART